ncbi:MAG: TetR/AcrR family transcriptional regulator [Terracidiphilus sp.]
MARTRSIEAHEKVLNAALGLFAERGIEATSMDAIAQASGVSKATIYNHWVDKEALLLEVMLMLNGLDREPEDVDTGDLQRDLTTVLTRKLPDKFDDARNRMMPTLIAYSAVHPEFGKAWRHRVMEPPRQCLKRVLRRGIARGLLPGNLDLEAAMALLLGPMLYAHVFHKEQHPHAPDLGPVTAHAFWRAYSKAREQKIERAGIKKRAPQPGSGSRKPR